MTTLITLDGARVDTVPAALALYPYGCFTTLLVETDRVDGAPAVLGWTRHAERLASGVRELWGHELDVLAVRALLRHHVLVARDAWSSADQGGLAARITIYPAEFELARPESAHGVRILISTSAVPGPGVASQLDYAPEPAQFTVRTVAQPRQRAHLKSTDLLGQIASRREARLSGADDALLVLGQEVLEGTTWSLVLWKDGSMRTPGHGVLTSTSVSALADIAPALGHRVEFTSVCVADLHAAELVLAVSVTQPVRPLTGVNDRALAVDLDLWRRVRGAFQSLTRDPL